jgi:hypothetical protein
VAFQAIGLVQSCRKDAAISVRLNPQGYSDVAFQAIDIMQISMLAFFEMLLSFYYVIKMTVIMIKSQKGYF